MLWLFKVILKLNKNSKQQNLKSGFPFSMSQVSALETSTAFLLQHSAREH